MLQAHLRTRFALLAVGCGLALGHRSVLPRPPAANLTQVAGYLGAVVGSERPLTVAPDSLQWEESNGPVFDLFRGRQVMFLAAEGPGQPNDVYRARVRVGPGGELLEVERWRNLTQTPLGDEVALSLHQQVAVFGSEAFGELQGLSVFELDGASDLGRGGPINQTLLHLRAFQETGEWHGLGRLHLTLNPSGPLSVTFDRNQVALALEGGLEGGAGAAVVDLSTKALRVNDGIVRSLAQQHYGGDYWVHSVVDVVRSAVGPGLLGWLEGHVFHWQDWWRQRHAEPLGAEQSVAVEKHPTPTPDAVVWPPPNIAPMFGGAEPQEGVWSAAGFDVGSAHELGSGESSPPFAKTWFRPDTTRPYAKLLLVAMDLRRLSLGMEAGFEEPRPKTGPPGRGSLTDDQTTRERVVATFNGAFKSVHGDYGMMVEGRVLVPPKPNAASVVVRQDGWVGLGTWSDSVDVPNDVRFFRQNLDPLVAGGQVNPTGRQEWGLKVASGSVVTERSALCRTSNGQLYYAWGLELTGESLARGLAHAGCTYALHLDMNPGHAGLVFTRITGTSPEGVQGQLATPEMTIHPREHALWSDKDFFYVLQADAKRSLPEKAVAVAWTPSPGPEPPPETWPALWEGTVQLGVLPVHLLRVEPGRLRYAMTASSMEPMVVGQAAPRRQLAAEEAASAVLALTFGHTTSRTRYGLVFGQRVTLPLQSGYGNLVIRGSGDIDVVGAQALAVIGEHDAVVQLPELVSNGAVTPQASLRGGRRVRGGICVIDGRMWVATVDHDSSDPVAVTLRNFGCQTVLELDRGSKHSVTIGRTDLAALNEPEGETGFLWALSTSMRPRTFEF